MPRGRHQPGRLRNGALNETAFQGHVVGLAGFYGWRDYHTLDSRGSKRGFPDLVLVRPPELLFVELKTDTGRLSTEQEDWMHDLRAVVDAIDAALFLVAGGIDDPPRIEAHVWRPRDWEAVEARLSRGRRRVPASFDPRR